MTVSVAAARAVLAANDRGGYTVPTAKLYPFQWNWDSAFVAMGFATYDLGRALTELERLAEGQWADGMIPHIVFHAPSDTYFPGPEVWGTHHAPPTSGITQPPVLAIALADLARRGADPARVARLYRAALANHRWWWQARDPERRGIVALLHPGRAGATTPRPGRSRSPACPRPPPPPCAAATPGTSMPPCARRTASTAASSTWWTPTAPRAGTPRACGPPPRSRSAMSASPRSCSAPRPPCWASPPRTAPPPSRRRSPRASPPARPGCAPCGAPRSASTPRATSSTAPCCKPPVPPASCPSSPPRPAPPRSPPSPPSCAAGRKRGRCSSPPPRATRPGFDAARYWRGPVWAVVNWLIAQGLSRHGAHDLARAVRADTRAAIEAAGFCEYFNPLTGAGLGGDGFSWTAAIYLLLAEARA